MTKKKSPANKKKVEDEPIAETGTDEYWIEKWKVFLESFHHERQDLILKASGHSTSAPGYYLNIISDMPRTPVPRLELDYNHLVDYAALGEHKDDAVDLVKFLKETPDQAIDTLSSSVKRLVRGVNEDYVKRNENFLNFAVSVKNYGIKKEIPEINVHMTGRFIEIEGFVIQRDHRRPFIAQAGFRCAKAQHLNYVTATNFQILRPLQCNDCESRRLTPEPKESTYIDIQEIKIQQRQDRSAPGKIPEPLRLFITNPNLIDRVQGGDYCKVTGIIRVLQHTESLSKNAIAGYYMEVNYIERKEDEYLIDTDMELENRVKSFMDPNHEADCLERLIMSVAPALYGSYSLKKALLCQFAGGDALKINSRRFRGEIQILVLGPPGSGKTTAAEYAFLVPSRVIWISPLVTDVGLTASVSNVDGVARLEAGAYLIASSPLGGLVVADEVQNYEDKALRVFSGIMDDRQRINVNKHGITADIQVNAATLALANPRELEGNWDRTRNISQNTGLPSWYLSRFDLIYIEDDIPDEKTDIAKVSHINAQFGSAIPEYKIRQMQQEGDEMGIKRTLMQNRVVVDGMATYSEVEMRAYIAYVRATYHPQFTKEALHKLQHYYLKLRKDQQMMQKGTGTSLKKITLRDYGALLRISSAVARICCRDEVLSRDADYAITLMMESIESSGFNPITGQQAGGPMTVNEVINEIDEEEEDNFAEQTLEYKRGKLRKIKNTFLRVLKHHGITDCKECQYTPQDGKYCPGCTGIGVIAEPLGEYALLKSAKDKGLEESRVYEMLQELKNRKFLLDHAIAGYYRLSSEGLRLVLSGLDDEIRQDFYDIYNPEKDGNQVNFHRAEYLMGKANQAYRAAKEHVRQRQEREGY